MRMIGMLALVLLGLLLAAFSYFRQQKAEQELTVRVEELTQTQAELRNSRLLIDSLVLLCQADTPASFGQPAAPGTAAIEAVTRLRKKGFQQPRAELLAHLQRQPSLVPVPGTAGGTMAYRALTLLTERYALGYFEDGHQGGYALLRFEAAGPEQIKWKLLDFYRL